jgi:hypothetical protein
MKMPELNNAQLFKLQQLIKQLNNNGYKITITKEADNKVRP